MGEKMPLAGSIPVPLHVPPGVSGIKIAGPLPWQKLNDSKLGLGGATTKTVWVEAFGHPFTTMFNVIAIGVFNNAVGTLAGLKHCFIRQSSGNRCTGSCRY